MKRFLYFLLLLAITITNLSAENSFSVYVDNNGVMRRNDTSEEVSFYGTNYTVPFAHAYRALGYLNVDRKQAIQRDVYHMARLGFNAFRLHLWDVELTDSLGNLLANDHLDLLDFLIYQLEQRDISIVLTAQTNFGNGYPERNVDTGAYSYDYDKCQIHDDKTAQAKQARYLTQLVKHVNSYTNRSLANDRSIIAIEINNEPCHSGKSADVTNYINRMVKAIRSGKWEKPILYNVSHNRQVVDAYFKADVQGTTYQWYPIHLVAGHERKGNFLPFVDQYDIPFSDVKGFDNKAKVVYEFDPADILYSYMYPAIARTFRKEGFQWITQFAYDPLDMAWANTEYQTHYLNLAYTPSKAISMKIAAEVTRNVKRGADFGKYPKDTIFDNFRVSYKQDLSEYNNGKSFIYSNNTQSQPIRPTELCEVAGVGSSPIVKYSGTGAYFLDRISETVWRLEVMPDVILTKDPFEKPSLSRRIGEILYTERDIAIDLNSLGDSYEYKAVNSGNTRKGTANDKAFKVYPGVYLLSANQSDIEACDLNAKIGNISISEYVAPAATNPELTVKHKPVFNTESVDGLVINATVFGKNNVDSVLVYPSDVSFWNDHNKLYKMTKLSEYEYSAQVDIRGKKNFRYNIVAYADGKSVTYPGAINGTPLDWDYNGTEQYSVNVFQSGDPIVLLGPSDNDGTEFSTIPEAWNNAYFRYIRRRPIERDLMHIHITPTESTTEAIIQKRVAEQLSGHSDLNDERKLVVSIANVTGCQSVRVSIVNSDGITFGTEIKTDGTQQEISLSDLKLSPTPLAPSPYPVFIGRYFTPDEYDGRPSWRDMEQIIISFPGVEAGTQLDADIFGVWLK
jgi:hypothetical protein